MQLLHAKSIESTVTHDKIKTRRGDMIDPFTLKLLPDAGDRPLDDIVSIRLCNGIETLEIEGAVTDMNNLDEIIYNGQKYQITERRKSSQCGLWESIKCNRALADGAE